MNTPSASLDPVSVPPGLLDPQQELSRQSARLQWLAAHPLEQPEMLVWESRRAIIAAPGDQRLPGFDLACAAMQQRGWPVVVRQTGGSAVPVLPGVVNLTLLLPFTAAAPELAQGYRLLCRPILSVLEAWGLAGSTGAVTGAICDGEFNVRLGDRKLVGTAQRQAVRTRGGAVLLQAGIMVDVDVLEASSLISDFYALAGEPRGYLGQSLVALRDALPADGQGDLLPRFIAALAAMLREQPPRL